MKNIVYKHTSIFILMLSMVFSLSSAMHENKKLTKKPVLSTAASTTSAATKTEPGSWDQLKSWITTSTAYSYLTLPFSPKYRIYSIASLCTGIAACFVIAQTGHSQEVTGINNGVRPEILGGDEAAKEDDDKEDGDKEEDSECPICYENYNDSDKKVMSMCASNHLACSSCLNKRLPTECHFCRGPVSIRPYQKPLAAADQGELKIPQGAMIGQQDEDLKAGAACSICRHVYDHTINKSNVIMFGVNIKDQKMRRPLRMCINNHHCCYDCVLMQSLRNGPKKCLTCDNPIQLKELKDDEWPKR